MGKIIEKDWVCNGLRCRVIGIPNLHRCGYVGVPEGHPLYGKHYRDVPDEIHADVHGGLSYSDSFCAAVVDVFPLWWFGFDCAHFGDAPDPALRDKDCEPLPFDSRNSGHVWLTDEVAAECEKLAKQLAGDTRLKKLKMSAAEQHFRNEYVFALQKDLRMARSALESIKNNPSIYGTKAEAQECARSGLACSRSASDCYL